jgi:hypothetical protein
MEDLKWKYGLMVNLEKEKADMKSRRVHSEKSIEPKYSISYNYTPLMI